MLRRLLFGSLFLTSVAACSGSGNALNVPDGVSAHVVDGIAVVAVRDGGTVTVFLAGDRRQEVLQYCERYQLLTTAEGGSAWSLDGVKRAGPSPSDLDRVASSVQNDGSVLVFIDEVIEAEDLSELQDSGTPFRPQLGPQWPERFKSPAAYCPSDV